MIKRIIFDIDNTLIDFPDYIDGYQSVLNKHHINKKAIDLYNAIGVYEECGKFNNYDKNKLLKFINEELNLDLDNSFIDDYFTMYNKLITDVSDTVKDTLDYLSKKYELVTLSNWFTFSQESRLKLAGIDKYFSKIYGTDIVPMKPKKQAFMSAIGDKNIDECLMIGDNIDMDIKVPYEMGMKVYYLSKGKKSNYPSIEKIEDLKDIL